MKRSLLDMTQSILSDLNSDNVNSIGDTEEALQVASIIKDTYYEMVATRNWPTHKELIQPDSSGTTSRPTHIKIPDDVHQIDSAEIHYNKIKSGETRKRYEHVYYMYPDEFLEYTNRRNSDEDNVDTILDIQGNVELLIKTDTAPTYWTSFDDEWIVFDSYDTDVDSTIQNSKIQMHVYKTPSWSVNDTFIPDLPIDAFPSLLAEAKSKAFIAIKEIPNEKEEQVALRQRRWLSRKAWKAKGGVRYPDYGRRGGSFAGPKRRIRDRNHGY